MFFFPTQLPRFCSIAVYGLNLPLSFRSSHIHPEPPSAGWQAPTEACSLPFHRGAASQESIALLTSFHFGAQLLYLKYPALFSKVTTFSERQRWIFYLHLPFFQNFRTLKTQPGFLLFFLLFLSFSISSFHVNKRVA